MQSQAIRSPVSWRAWACRQWTRKVPWDEFLHIHHSIHPKPKGKPTYWLVTQMTDKGLRFAPAVPGDEAAYAALREVLAACDRAAAKSQSAMR